MSDLEKARRLFPRDTKIKLVLLLIGIIVGALIEMWALSIITPFISIMMDSSLISQNRPIRVAYRILGFQSVEPFLAFLSLLLAMLYIFRGLYLYGLSRIQYGFLARSRVRLSDRLLEKTLQQPYLYHVNHNIAEMQQLIVTQVEVLFGVINQALAVLADGFMSIFIVSYLVSVSPTMTAVVMSFSLICIIVYFRIFRVKIKVSGERNYNLIVAIGKSVNQALYGIKEIKIMRREEYFKRRFKTVSDEAIGIIQRFQSLVNLPKLFIESFCFGGAFIVVAFSIRAGADMQQLVPQLSVFVLAGFRLLPAISRMVTQATNVLHQKACIRVLYMGLYEPEKLYIETLPEPKIDVVSPDIAVSNVTFKYPNMPNPVLEDVSLVIPNCQSVALVGQSGAGKSTLTDVILGILSPQAGSVIYNGKSIHHEFDWWAQRVGYIPQVIYLLDETITENVAFGIDKDKIDEEKVWYALEQAQIKEFVLSLPDQLNTMIGDRGIRLSGGQRQRLGIARALYNDPPILVLDEATSSLDNDTEAAVMEAIQGLQGTKTMIIVAHRLSTIQHCDIVYRVEDGHVTRER